MNSPKIATAAAAFLIATAAAAPAATIVINEVYGGGGNASATFNQDFVELFNTTANSIDISNYAVQYVSAAGTFTSGSTIATIPANTFLTAGSFYLISSGSVGANGIALPTPNQAGSSSASIAVGGGKVRLLESDGTTVVDLLGYGATATQSEGAVAPAASNNTTSLQRVPNGQDTDSNSADFSLRSPTPGFTNVPEPSTGVSLLGGIAVLCTFRRFRSHRPAGRP